MLPPKPTIRFQYPSQAAAETMAALVDRAVIFRDDRHLFELIGGSDQWGRFDFRLRRIESQRLQLLMRRAAHFEKLDGRTSKCHRIDAPMKVARLILRMRDQWPFKRLETPEPMNHVSEVLRCRS
jgi:hypothetical protein